ncbi:MAG: signal peptide peptidase SppA [[Eubacterium] sulci]|nr:signal peptide peptidase SppA [[Eubacterium] sulci]MBF1181227.1 signal peptide peptidase SppA [[Eubacterium] sulci]
MDRDDREFDKYNNGSSNNDNNQQRQSNGGFVPWSAQQQNGQNQQYQQRRYEYYGSGPGFNMAPQPVRRNSGLKVGLIIALVVIGFIFIAGVGCNALVSGIFSGIDDKNIQYEFGHDYVGVLSLSGTITDGDSRDGYSQDWILDRIDHMKKDSKNKGILLSVNTPGGSAYATAELYNALLDYKKVTGNKIYVYFGSQATSGGYYAAMAGDKIYANQECWTGSIGVIVGPMYNLSGLYEKFGIQPYSFKSGANKDIGANYKDMTDEQRSIMQSLVDDSYNRFVKAVMDGRKMDEATVRTLGDGRIYSANQALENGLIDKIGSLDDAIEAMRNDCGLDAVDFENIVYEQKTSFRDLFGFSSEKKEDSLDKLLNILESSNKASIQYIAPVQKQ